MTGTSDATNDDAKNIVNSVLRACRILELLADEGPDLSLARVAEATELSRPTAHRLLGTLVMAGWVRRTATGRYSLTMRVFTVGSSASSGTSLRELAHAALVNLAQVSGDTAYLMVPNEGTALCIDRVEGPHPVRVHHVSIGDAISLLSGAAPIAMTAFEPDLLAAAIDKRTAAVPAMAARLREARRVGYVVSPDDLISGVTAVGAAIFDSEGSVVGGISVTGVNDRYDQAHIQTAVNLVTQAAAEVSELLGYTGEGRSPRRNG